MPSRRNNFLSPPDLSRRWLLKDNLGKPCVCIYFDGNGGGWRRNGKQCSSKPDERSSAKLVRQLAKHTRTHFPVFFIKFVFLVRFLLRLGTREGSLAFSLLDKIDPGKVAVDEIKEAFCRDVDNLDLKPQVCSLFAYIIVHSDKRCHRAGCWTWC